MLHSIPSVDATSRRIEVCVRPSRGDRSAFVKRHAHTTTRHSSMVNESTISVDRLVQKCMVRTAKSVQGEVTSNIAHMCLSRGISPATICEASECVSE